MFADTDTASAAVSLYGTFCCFRPSVFHNHVTNSAGVDFAFRLQRLIDGTVQAIIHRRRRTAPRPRRQKNFNFRKRLSQMCNCNNQIGLKMLPNNVA
jgi:hypothetical protein